MGMRETQGTLLLTRKIAEHTFLWRIAVDEDFAREAQPGQFVHIEVGGSHVLRRPISIHDVEGRVLSLIIYQKGEGTRSLLEKREGAQVCFTGPIGNGFSAGEAGEPLWLVGGGIGVAPLLYAARAFLRDHPIEVFAGFRTGAQAYALDALAAFGQVYVVTDDGSLGVKGLVTDLLEAKIKDGARGRLLVCGPTPMMAAVQRLALAHGLEGELSLEQRMGCGIGGCQVCVCKQKYGDDFKYRRVCVDGPVLPIGEVAL